MMYCRFTTCFHEHKRAGANMSLFSKILSDLKTRYPCDPWLCHCDAAFASGMGFRDLIDIYDSALATLDNKSLLVLREKLLEKFGATDRDRGKNQFFSTMNEALAFQHLVERGYTDVRLIREAKTCKTRTPDIEFIRRGAACFCEVKTIGESDEHLKMTASNSATDNEEMQCVSFYPLAKEFLCKLCNTISIAESQIGPDCVESIVYVIVHFDDFLVLHFESYKQDILSFLSDAFPSREVLVRVGISGRKTIHHVPLRER